MKHLFALILIVLLLPVTVFAHSGKTDSNGGHWDHSNGEYHYHHGYPAHDHYDMDGDGFVDCPYLFDDKTDHTPGGSGSSSESIIRPSPTLEPTESSPPQSNPPAYNSSKRHENTWPKFLSSIIYYLCCFVMAFFAVGHIWAFVSYCICKLTAMRSAAKDRMDTIAVIVIIALLVILYLVHLYWRLPIV